MSASSSPAPAPGTPGEVRYSLVGLLKELKAERASATFAMERLDQHEIKKLFKPKTPRARRKK